MTFDITNLQPVGGQGKRGKSSQRWAYWTLDAHATVDSSSYFNADTAYGGAYQLLERADIIDVVVWSGAIGGAGNVLTYGPHIVMTKSAGTINVSAVTAGTVTNSD